MPEVSQWGPQPFTNRNGRPLPTASVRVFEPDGVTPATLYADQTGTTTVTQPLPIGVDPGVAGIDALGNVIFFAEPGPYVIAVTYNGGEVWRSPIVINVDIDAAASAGLLAEEQARLAGDAALASALADEEQARLAGDAGKQTLIVQQDDEPSSPTVGDLWLDTDADPYDGVAAETAAREADVAALTAADAALSVADATHANAGDPHPGYRLEATLLGNADIADAAAIAESKLNLASDAAAGTASRRSLGTGATQALPGNHSSTTDARAPTGPAGGVLSGTYPNPGFATTPMVGSNNLSELTDTAAAAKNLTSTDLVRVAAVAVANVASLSGTTTIDDVALVAGDRVLLVRQTTGTENGVWVVAAGAWSRAADLPAALSFRGRKVLVTGGTIFTGTEWQCVSGTAKVVGTDALTWTRNDGLSVTSVIAATGSTETADFGLYDVFDWTLDANCTFSFSNVPGTPQAPTKLFIIRQDGTGGRTVTLPSGFKWPGGGAYTPSTAASAIDRLLVEVVASNGTYAGTFAKGYA